MALPLACSTGPFYMLPLTTGVELIGRAGFDALEVMVTGDKRTQDGSLLKALAADHGLSVESIHAPFLLLTRGVFTTDPIEKIKRSVEVAEAAGASTVVVHPPYRWQSAYTTWLERDLAGFASGTGITISMENMFPVWVRGRGVAFHRIITPDDLRPFDHVTLDTSHCAVAGIDILGAFDALRDRIGHIHLSNNLGNGRDTHSPLATGVLPIEAFLRRMTEAGYAGSVTLEMDVRERANRPDDLVALLTDQVALMRDVLR